MTGIVGFYCGHSERTRNLHCLHRAVSDGTEIPPSPSSVLHVTGSVSTFVNLILQVSYKQPAADTSWRCHFLVARKWRKAVETVRPQTLQGLQTYSHPPFVPARLPAGLPVGRESGFPAAHLANKWGDMAEWANRPLQLSGADLQNKSSFMLHLLELNWSEHPDSRTPIHKLPPFAFLISCQRQYHWSIDFQHNIWVCKSIGKSYCKHNLFKLVLDFDAFYIFPWTTLTLLSSLCLREGFTLPLFLPQLSWLCGKTPQI